MVYYTSHKKTKQDNRSIIVANNQLVQMIYSKLYYIKNMIGAGRAVLSFKMI